MKEEKIYEVFLLDGYKLSVLIMISKEYNITTIIDHYSNKYKSRLEKVVHLGTKNKITYTPKNFGDYVFETYNGVFTKEKINGVECYVHTLQS